VPHGRVAPLRRLPLLLLAALPLIAWPGLSYPFSTPKLWTLVASVIALAPIAWLALRHRSDLHTIARPQWVLVVVALWLASWSWSAIAGDFVSLEPLLLAFASALLAVILTVIAPRPEEVAAAMIAGATAVAAVALGQWVGVDAFSLAGWAAHAPNANAAPRLRIYGTLGNPNFVAALLAATLPLTLALAALAHSARRLRTRNGLFVAIGLQALALIATGSRGGALGVIAATLVFGVTLGWRRQSAAARARVAALVVLLGIGLALIAIVLSTARPLADTAAGRAYIVRVSWPHAFEAPWTGRGPGAFELLYPRWELDARHTDRDGVRFGGPQQHAHNDYLEALIERGLLGPVTILAIVATCFWNGWRHTRAARDAPLVAGTLAMLAALAVMACVDFPLARPTEAAWWWCGVAMIALIERRG
jgi:putative inorganic carbon (hco3(-)) transporter